ncbi:MAG: hypothetical protein RL026_341 [Pseudomonadota bacterium]|jgi:CBS-domain-containing membrane protein
MKWLPPTGAPPVPPLRVLVFGCVGTALAIGLTGALSVASGVPWLMAPFGASCVLAFGLPEAPLAQPRAIIGGHLVCAAVGLAALSLFGSGWWVTALAVALALLLMFLLRVVHAPAGSNPVLLAAAAQAGAAPGPEFLLAPVLAGSVTIVVLAWAVNNLRSRGSYPRYWW